MQWERPDFVALDGLRTNEYTIFSTNGIHFNKPVRFDLTAVTFYTEIYEQLEGIDDLETTEELYQFSVALDVGKGGQPSAPAVCDINLIERGIIIFSHCLLRNSCSNITLYKFQCILFPALDPPLPFHTTCPTTYTPSQSVIYRWDNPLAAPNFGVDVLKISLAAICLYGNHSLYHVSL